MPISRMMMPMMATMSRSKWKKFEGEQRSHARGRKCQKES